jgi:ABC-type Fe3+ transport system permease subunit
LLLTRLTKIKEINMKKLIARIFATLALTLLPAAVVVYAAEDNKPPSKNDVCAGISIVSGDGSCDDGTSVGNVVARGIGILAWIVGIVATVVIIISGITLATSGGDSGALSKAKNTILYAAIGLALAIFAGTIVSYIVGQASGDVEPAADPDSGSAKSVIPGGAN